MTCWHFILVVGENMRNKISVVLPVYNGEKYLRGAIESIINQTYVNWELIIVNDCSADNSLKIAQEYAQKDGRIKIISNKVNKKLPASLNVGFANATGDYYTWTSDDNEYYPEAFEKMEMFLSRNLDYGYVYACANLEIKGEMTEYVWCCEPTSPTSILTFSTPGACFMYRADIAKEVGEYSENWFLNEDHEYWLRLFLKTKFGNISEILYLYRNRNGSLTNTRQKEIDTGKIALLRKYRKIYKDRFYELKDSLRREYLADSILSGEISLSEIRKINKRDKDFIYNMFKREYKVLKSSIYLKSIVKLGPLYCLKALRLVFYRKNKK